MFMYLMYLLRNKTLELELPGTEMGTTVDIKLWSILNHSTANRDISLTCGSICLASSLIFRHLQLLLPLTSSSMITSQRRWALWKSRMKTSATSPQNKTWDVFGNLAQNTSQVLVHVDDADVFLVFLYHAHHLCEVVMKLSAGTIRDA